MQDFTKEEKMQQSMRLRYSRTIRGLSVDEFSEKIGISVSGYQKVENGQNAISRRLLRNIWKEFHISSDYILYGDYKDVRNIVAAAEGCRDIDKLYILLHLAKYFILVKEKGKLNVKISDQEFIMKMCEWMEIEWGRDEKYTNSGETEKL